MYLISRIFFRSDVAFISYISLNFLLGLCTMLMTLMPWLLAFVSKAQVSDLPQALGLTPRLLLLFQLELSANVLVSTVFTSRKRH